MIASFATPAWRPPGELTSIEVLDMHTGGEPLRVIVSGLPPLEGSTVLEKRRHFSGTLDNIRTALMWEPRGHADMYGAVVTPSEAGADFDVFFLHNEGYSTMCGHAIIALTRLIAEALPVAQRSRPISFDVPAGRVEAWAEFANGKFIASHFRNVASYVAYSDETIDLGGYGRVRFDVAYGGAYYAVVRAQDLGVSIATTPVSQLIDLGMRIKRAVAAAFPISHPYENDLSFLYGTIIIDAASNAQNHSRNLTIFADGEVDRSSTGSGVSARAALHFAKGELAQNEIITIESVTGSTMSVRVIDAAKLGPHRAVIPEVSGTAHYTGRSTFYLCPEDPLRNGFLVR